MKRTRTSTSVRYEHRVIQEHNAGDFYGSDYIFRVGQSLGKTKNPSKFKYYGVTLGHGVGVDVPAEKVQVFKITKTTTVTETEEAL